MATKLKIKRSSVSGVVPTTLDIDQAELAVNLADKKLFTSNGSTVLELGSNLTNLSVSANLTLKSVIANGSLGSNGQILTSNGSAVYWANSTVTTSVVISEQFTANGTANSFTVTGGYIPSAIEVYVSGVKQIPGTDVFVSSGNTISFAVPPLDGQIIDVFGYKDTTGIVQQYGTVTSITAGNGLSGGQITTSGTISVLANSGIVANATGVHVNTAYISSIPSNSNTFTIGTSAYFVANGNVGIGNSTPNDKLFVSGAISDDKGEVRTLVLSSKTTSYTLIANDHGQLISTNATIIIPASVFTAGQNVTIYNNSTANITINTTSAGVTCYLAGSANTSSRTLAQRGIATIVCIAANNFVISGGGLT